LSTRRLIRGIKEEDLTNYIDDFSVEFQSNPFTSMFVVPTPGLRDRIRGMLMERDIPIVDSAIRTLDDFPAYILDSLDKDHWAIDDRESELILHRILMEKRDQLPLLMGEGDGQSMVPQLRAFIHILMEFKVDYPKCLGELQGERSRELTTILQRYLGFMRLNGCLDSMLAKGRAIEELGDGRGRYDRILFYGFYEPAPIDRDLICAVSSVTDRADLCVPYLPDPDIHEDDGAWFSPDEVINLEDSGVEREALSLLQGGEGNIDRLRMSRFRDRIEEARSVAQRISDLIRSGVKEGRIAIMLPMRSKSAPLIRWALDDCGITSDVMIDSPLVQSPTVQAMTDVLEVISSNYSREAVIRLLRSPFVGFRFGEDGRSLSGSQVDHISLEAGVLEGRDQWMSALGALRTSIENELTSPEIPDWNRKRLEWKIGTIQRVSEGLGLLFDLLSGLNTNGPLGEMTQRYRSALKRLEVDHRVSREGVMFGEGSSMKTFMDVLDSLETGPLRGEKVDLREFIDILALALTSSTYKAEERNENAVQVIGLRGSVFMNYDHVFIPGMVDGEIPFLTAELALSTEEEKRRMCILSRQDMLRHERYYLIHALTLAREMTYLSAPLSDSDSKLVPSSFFDRLYDEGIEGFECSRFSSSTLCSQRMVGERISGKLPEVPGTLAPTGVDPSEVLRRINVERCHRKGEYDTCFDAVLQDDEIGEEIRSFHEERTFSPTMLETYAECPFWYYMRYVLRIAPPPELEMEISPKDRGTLFHRIAHRFYSSRREMGKGKISGGELIQEYVRMIEIAKEELSRYSFTGPAWNAFRIGLMGTPTRSGLLLAFMEHEIKNPLTGLEPSHFELSMGVPLCEWSDPGSIEGPVSIPLSEGEQLRLRCKIDRVDTSSKGEFFVIDYKTGGWIPYMSEIKAGRKLQIPLYILAYAASNPGTVPIGGTYYQVKSVNDIRYGSTIGDSFYAPLMGRAGKSGGVNPEFKKLIEGTRLHVSTHLQKIGEGRFHPRICDRKCPSYCDYSRICRFNELRLFEMEVEDGSD